MKQLKIKENSCIVTIEKMKNRYYTFISNKLSQVKIKSIILMFGPLKFITHKVSFACMCCKSANLILSDVSWIFSQRMFWYYNQHKLPYERIYTWSCINKHFFQSIFNILLDNTCKLDGGSCTIYLSSEHMYSNTGLVIHVKLCYENPS